MTCGTGPHVACHGKGRKDRITQLTVAALRAWEAAKLGADPGVPLFPPGRGTRLSRDVIEHRLAHYTTQASSVCPSLRGTTVTAHVLRPTTAMRLLHAGVDTGVIAVWLGSVSVEPTQMYLHADMTLKENALARTSPPPGERRDSRYRPPATP